MSIADLKRAFDLIDANAARADFEGEKDERLIAQAEEVLGFRFPPTYRKFLMRYGCGDIAGQEFYGLLTDDFTNACVPDAIWLTLKQRAASGLPHNLVVVYATGDGTYFALDCTGSSEDDEYPVVAWIPGESKPSDVLEVVAKDFGVFMREVLEQSL
jgi:hypothetical protein